MRGTLSVESVMPDPGRDEVTVIPCTEASGLPCCEGGRRGTQEPDRSLWGLPCALLVVANRSRHSLWSFNVKGSVAGGWGVDVLEGAIPPGESRAWEISPGIHHLRVETAEGHHLHHFGVELKAGQLARWVVEEGG